MAVTITTINGTDQPKNSRAAINTNFANLNSGKQDAGSQYHYFALTGGQQYIAFGDKANSWTFADATQTWLKLDRTAYGSKQSTLCLPPAGGLNWAGSGDAGTLSVDVGIGRASAGVLEVTDGTGGANLRDIKVRNVLTALTTPASSSAAGVAGTIVADANYVYVCTATNTWKRAALSTF